MAVSKERKTHRRSPPAGSPEARENELISLATDLAEKQLREGTASAQVIVHFLKLASSKEELEKENLKKRNEMITAKTESIKTGKRIEELYERAIDAMRMYSGEEPGDNEDLF